MTSKMLVAATFSFLFLIPTESFAWGRRGHSIVCQTAAYLDSNEPKAEFFKATSFDLGYYCNVPDLIWKRPATYKQEWFNHFMDMEIFNRLIKKSPLTKPYELDRDVFNVKFPEIKNEDGRAWWRIRELEDQLKGITEQLKKDKGSSAEKKASQLDWLVEAGAIGHYIGDLSQPLHVTENYDGQLSGQKGIHAYFEETVIDELYHSQTLGLEDEVMKAAEANWKKNQKFYATESTLALIEKLTETSNQRLVGLLAIDKKVGRTDIKKAAAAYRSLAIESMADGAVIVAEIWRRHIGWEFDSDRFFNFDPAPAFIELPKIPAK